MTTSRIVDEPLLLFGEFCQKGRFSSRKGRRIIAAGEVGIIRIGGQVLIPESEVERFLRERYRPPRELRTSQTPETVVAVLDKHVPRKRGMR